MRVGIGGYGKVLHMYGKYGIDYWVECVHDIIMR